MLLPDRHAKLWPRIIAYSKIRPNNVPAFRQLVLPRDQSSQQHKKSRLKRSTKEGSLVGRPYLNGTGAVHGHNKLDEAADVGRSVGEVDEGPVPPYR